MAQFAVDIRPWSQGDLPLLERLMGDPTMTEHIGEPETPAKIRERHERYCRTTGPGAGHLFVILHGPGRVAAGDVGYWEKGWRGVEFEYPPGHVMRCNNWRPNRFAAEVEPQGRTVNVPEPRSNSPHYL